MAQDYFTLLGVERRFDLDPALLEHHYYSLQRQYHPDRAPMTLDRQRILQQSIDINHAYDTLKSPLTRAQHLLSLQGIIVGSERDSVKPEPSVLTESMEWREALEDAGNPAAVEELYRKAFKAREACVAALSDACIGGHWQEAAQTALKLGYLEKLLDDIQRKARAA